MSPQQQQQMMMQQQQQRMQMAQQHQHQMSMMRPEMAGATPPGTPPVMGGPGSGPNMMQGPHSMRQMTPQMMMHMQQQQQMQMQNRPPPPEYGQRMPVSQLISRTSTSLFNMAFLLSEPEHGHDDESQHAVSRRRNEPKDGTSGTAGLPADPTLRSYDASATAAAKHGPFSTYALHGPDAAAQQAAATGAYISLEP